MGDAIDIDGVRFFECTDNLIVNEKDQVIGLPIDLSKDQCLQEIHSLIYVR
jgi:hypothetical protein